jgi:hypothetical protein
MDQIESLNRCTVRKLRRRTKQVKEAFSKVQDAEARNGTRRRLARYQQAVEKSLQKLNFLVDSLEVARIPVDPKGMIITDEERNLIRRLYETIASVPDTINDEFIAQIVDQGQALAELLLTEIPTANMGEQLWEPDTGKCLICQQHLD